MAPPGDVARVTGIWQRFWLSRWAKPVLLTSMLVPLAALLIAALLDDLGANPAQTLVRSTGDWTLRTLALVLAITPLRVLSAAAGLARVRRMAGLTAYAYALLHLLCYAWLDMGADPSAIVHDIAKRPFILVGMLTWLMLTVLALTSPQAVVRWLGGARWRAVHRLVYVAAPLALLHFFWMRAAKRQWGEVIVEGVMLALLLGWRLVRFARKNSH